MVRRAGRFTNFAQALGFSGFLALVGAPASADDYSACAKIDNAFAYNQCLANHGPPAHRARAIAAPESEVGPQGASQTSEGKGRVRTAMQFSRSRNGKMIAIFSVGEAPTAAVSHKRKKTP